MRVSKPNGKTGKPLRGLVKMKIKGLQKVTLVDYPDKIACTIFLFGCNFRCGFCYNPEIVLRDETLDIPKDYVLDFLKKRKGVLEGICITGGEPLLTLEKEFVKQIKDLGFLVKLDTNGSFPEKLKELIDEKLIDYVAMDIKSSKENYEKTISANLDLNKIEESIKIISSSNLPYDFRTTIIPGIHTKEEMIKLSKWLNELIGKNPENFSLQGFKNHGKFIDSNYLEKQSIREIYLEELKETIKDYFQKITIKG